MWCSTAWSLAAILSGARPLLPAYASRADSNIPWMASGSSSMLTASVQKSQRYPWSVSRNLPFRAWVRQYL